MASGTRRFFQSPLRVVLIFHALCALATLAVLALALWKVKQGATGLVETLGAAVQAGTGGGGGMTLMWVTFISLGLLLVASLVLGLVYGRWGLPGYLQGRAVYFVPFLAAAYFVIGRLTLAAIDLGGLAAGWAETLPLVKTSAGLTLLLLYAALSTSAVGVGWAVALAVTQYKRRRGKWETIGYVERA